jgi:hypothetical protein
MRRIAWMTALALVACGEQDEDHGHDHAAQVDHHNHAPKYGGQLIELGEHEFQVELLLYPESGKVEAYLWDGHVERAVPSAMTSMTVRAAVGGETIDVELKPAANPYADDEEGKSSKFAGQSDALKNLEHFDGELAKVTIAGKTFGAIDFHYHPGTGPDHDPDHEDGPDEDKGHDR